MLFIVKFILLQIDISFQSVASKLVIDPFGSIMFIMVQNLAVK